MINYYGAADLNVRMLVHLDVTQSCKSFSVTIVNHVSHLVNWKGPFFGHPRLYRRKHMPLVILIFPFVDCWRELYPYLVICSLFSIHFKKECFVENSLYSFTCSRLITQGPIWNFYVLQLGAFYYEGYVLPEFFSLSLLNYINVVVFWRSKVIHCCAGWG